MLGAVGDSSETRKRATCWVLQVTRLPPPLLPGLLCEAHPEVGTNADARKQVMHGLTLGMGGGGASASSSQLSPVDPGPWAVTGRSPVGIHHLLQLVV